jgi:ElaB/YqjD/DUF883 family membrane-anchored ribosome-binding protein|uniref:Uncharacterized protein n=1 Tax=Panagrolaimus sp. PS1159 TaxID=55785 RepID=A0AC35F651_9BILA
MNSNNTTTVFKRTDINREHVVAGGPQSHVVIEPTLKTVIGPEGQVSTGPLHLEQEKEKHGLLHDIKEGVKDVVEAITGRTSPTPKDHLKEAKHLQKKAEHILKDTKKDFKKAEKAQEKADKEAEKANHKTEKALNKQAHGQELLAEAGAELIEAGAMMQKEASDEVGEAPYNIHKTGEVRQATCVDASGQEAAIQAHHAPLRVVEYGATHVTHPSH